MKKFLAVILALAMMMTSVLALADTSYTGKADSQIGGVDAVTVTVTLKQLVMAVDAKWDNLTATQQEALKDMYETFASDMASWQIPNIKANA